MSYPDLPTHLGSNAGPAYVMAIEAVRLDQDERAVAAFTLPAADVHSDQISRLRQRPDRMPVRTFERWLRIRLVEPASATTTRTFANLHFWLPNYDPNNGWSLTVGTAVTYRAPTAQRSIFAQFDPPVDEPGLPLAVTPGPGAWESDWIVSQATWSSDEGAYELQPTALRLELSWDETGPT